MTATSPKALLPIAGVPLVTMQLEPLTRVGIDHVILAIGQDHQERWQAFVDGYRGPLRLELAVEPTPLDTAGAVRAIIDRLDERLLVLNGDVLFDAALDPLTVEPAAGSSGVLMLAEVDDPTGYGVVVADAEGRILRFVEKPPPGTAPTRTVSAGVYWLRREALAAFPTGRLSFERDVFPRLVADGTLRSTVVSGRWLDIGTPARYLEAHRRRLAGDVLDAVTGHGSDRDAVIAPGSVTGSWWWVAGGATVEPEAEVRESVVLEGTTIRAGSVVAGAIIGSEAEIGPDATVGDLAVVGAGARIGPGCEIVKGARIAPDTVLGESAIRFRPPNGRTA